jgi:hypothetical protein
MLDDDNVSVEDFYLDLDMEDQNIHNAFLDLRKLDYEIDEMISLGETISTHGISPSLLYVISSKESLYKTTTLNTVNMESLKEGWRPNDPRVKIAVEAVGTALGRVITSFIGKASGVLTAIGSRILKVLTGGVKLLTSPLTLLTAAIGAGVVTTSDVITAHPWQTVMMAASAMAGFPALIALVTRTSLPSSMIAMRMWYKLIADGISKAPLGKFFSVKVHKEGLKLVRIVKEPVTAAASRLGYQGSVVQRVVKSVIGLFGKNGPIMQSFGILKTWIGKAFSSLKTLDKSLMAPKKTAIGKVLRFSWDMFRSSFTTPLGLLMTSVSQFSKALKKSKLKEDDAEIEKHNEEQKSQEKTG